MEFLDGLSWDEQLRYTSIGSRIAEESGLRGYMKEHGETFPPTIRTIIYRLVGAANDSMNPKREGCAGYLREEAKTHAKKLPDIMAYVERTFDVTALEGEKGVRETEQVNLAEIMEALPEVHRREVYRAIGEGRLGIRKTSKAIGMAMGALKNNGINGIDIMFQVSSSITSRLIKEDSEKPDSGQ